MHAARAHGVVVMSWWWSLALLALSAPARATPRAGSGYQMSRKSCTVGGSRGACMWVQECNRVGGIHAGVCVDGFMFGSCCRMPDRPITETPIPTTVTDRPSTTPSYTTTSATTITPSTTQTIRPSSQTARPSFMTKPIDGAPTSYSYRPPEINLPSVSSLDANSEQNSDIVHKLTYSSVNKYQNVHRPSNEMEASPHNKISSSLSLMGARPMAVSEQHSENSIASAHMMSRPNNLNTIHWQATTEPIFVTKPRPNWEKPVGKPKPTKKFTTTTSKPHKNYIKPKDPALNMINKTDESTPASIQTTAATNSVECGTRAMWPRPETRIMGGKDSSFGRWPWQVSVRRNSFFGFSSTHRCGGAIINEGWIATAGHCVDDLLTSQIRIRVGEYDFSTVSEQYPYSERGVARKAVHPKYNFYTYEYDLALVKLDSPVQFAPHISPICLPASDDLLVGENATVTGWGRLSEGGVLPSVLQEVQVPIVSNDRCKSMFLQAGRHEFIPDIFLCAGHERGGHDSCQGDSGGPLQVKGKDQKYFLAGIISWGIGCGEANLPGVCTRISKFVPWILQTVNS
ncbi:serine proteinase stubble isoform X2 [Danaus plexippus]|uniref:serine proteinase stubble isoform X2 n=1 Tax=Danaus plexippus TaxID=13037 RepID=UPI002AAF7BCA|nr:serine proteinase stubble isoform X2 [Danaus plexippus]